MTDTEQKNRINVPRICHGTESNYSYRIIFATPSVIVSVKQTAKTYLVRVEKTCPPSTVSNTDKLEKYLKKQSEFHWSTCFTGYNNYRTIIKYLANTFIEV